MTETLRMMSWNVNGVRAAYKKGLLDWLNEANPDLLFLQETKARPEQLPKALKEADGYNTYWHWAEIKKGYSGVAAFSKTAPDHMERGLGIERFDQEGRVIKIQTRGLSIFNVYFPNGKKNRERLDYKMDFYDAFLERVEGLRKNGEKIIFCGDVNTAHKEIDLARPKENEKVSGFLPIEREWIDKVIQKGYVDIFRRFNQKPDQYTWWDLKSRARERNVGWRIDYFFVAQEIADSVKDAYILPEVMGSDHCPIGMDISV
jgi:exodeoxyribonuclease-3